MNNGLLLIFFIISSFHCSAQGRDNYGNYFFWPYNEATQKIEFSDVVNTPEASTDTLYSIAKHFIKNTFNSRKDTLYQDDSSKMLFCKSAWFIPVEELGERGKGYISFTLLIECKYHYYRYSLTNLEHFPACADCVVGGPLENEKTASGGMLFTRSYWEKQKTKCYLLIQATIQQLKDAMSKAEDS